MHIRRLKSVSIALLLSVAASACSPQQRPVAGVLRGDFFYPDFQRWQIVAVERAEQVTRLQDAAGIPAILRGRPLYLSSGYLTMPFLNGGGDTITPMCFRLSEGGLEARVMTGRTSDANTPPLIFERSGERLTLRYGPQFRVTLEKRDAPDDAVRKRAFDAHFNKLLSSGAPRVAARNACELREAVVEPPLTNADLSLVAATSGRRRTVAGADLDPATPISFGGSSVESRTQINPALPTSNLAGCSARTQIVRLNNGELPLFGGRSEYYLSTSIIGQSSTGERCDRLKSLRRVDPEEILALFDIPVTIASRDGTDSVGIRLLRWTDADTFRASIGRVEFEVTVSIEPELHVSLVSEVPRVPVAAVSVPPAGTPAPGSPPRPAPTAPVRSDADLRGENVRSVVLAGQRLALLTQGAIYHYYMDEGRWPTGFESLRGAGPRSGAGIERITVDTGTIVIEFGADVPELAGKRLVLRPTIGVSSSMYWTCGYARAPAGSFEAPSGPSARVETTVDRSYLAPNCQ